MAVFPFANDRTESSLGSSFATVLNSTTQKGVSRKCKII